MMKSSIIILLVFAAVASAAESNSTLGNNQNVTAIFENALNMIGNLFENPDNETGNTVNSFLKNVLGNTNTGNKADSSGIGQISDMLQLLKIVQPFFNGTGIPDLSNILPQALNFVMDNRDALAKSDVSASCKSDVNQWFDGLQKFEGWAWKMLDAGFKPSSAIAEYNLKWLGDREECLSIQSYGSNAVKDNMEPFHGKYCRLILPSGAGNQMLVLGACASHRCSNEDVSTLVALAISLVSFGTFQQEVITSCIEDIELDGGAKAAICILAILGALVFIGTLYDVIVVQLATCDNSPAVAMVTTERPIPSYEDAEKQENGIGLNNEGYISEKVDLSVEMKKYEAKDTTEPQIPVTSVNQQNTKPVRGVSANVLLAFSAYTNGCKLLGTNQGSGSLGAVNGIRFLSMAWVILGHSYFFAGNYTSNMIAFGSKKMYQWSFMSVLYASVSVDSFFALSGTLVAYLTLREMKKVGGAMKFNWFMFYFHRFWRLTPPYMLVLMVGTTLYKYIGTGAMKSDGDQPMMASCRTNWWTNLLYVNNYVYADEQCMGWSWYLANDMQLYVVSPILLVPLFYNVIFGGILSAVLIGLAIALSGILTHNVGYLSQGVVEAGSQPERYMLDFYIPMWARFGPYIVGLVTGYILYRTKCKCKIPKVVNIVCWIVCIGSICAIIYGPYTDHDSHIFSKAENVIYNAFFRTSWGALICWIIFACATGNGGWINTVLSWSPFIPLGRLTYCAYLLHPLVMTMYYETLDRPIHFSENTTIYMFIGNMVLSYGVSFIASLFFESPMMGLEKAIFKKK